MSFALRSLGVLGVLLAWQAATDTSALMWSAPVATMVWVAALLQHRVHRQHMQAVQRRMEQREHAHQSVLQAQARQDQLLAAMSHELRTPMNAILGLHGALRQHVATDPQQVARVDHIQQACAHMLRLINQSLDYARLLAHRLAIQPQPVALAALLRSTAQEWEGRVTLDLTEVEALWVHADAQRLKQTVGCALEVCMGAGSARRVQVSVRRTDAFWRFEFATAGQAAHPLPEGAALTKALCLQLVALQQGQTAATELGAQVGTWWFALPLPEVPAPLQDAAAQIDALRARELQLLVVDDNEVNRVVAQMALRKALPRANVQLCADATTALAWLQTHACDLVLMDIVMPEVDGLRATRLLRAQNGPQAHTPVLAMTGIDQPEDRVACEQAGMCGLLSKPLVVDQVLPAIAHALSSTSTGRAA